MRSLPSGLSGSVVLGWGCVIESPWVLVPYLSAHRPVWYPGCPSPFLGPQLSRTRHPTPPRSPLFQISMNIDLHLLISLRYSLQCVPSERLSWSPYCSVHPNNLCLTSLFSMGSQLLLHLETICTCLCSPASASLLMSVCLLVWRYSFSLLNAWHILMLLNLGSQPVPHVRYGHPSSIRQLKGPN